MATKLEEFLNEISEGSETPVESEEAVEDNRINSGLSLQELSKIIGISEYDLQDF